MQSVFRICGIVGLKTIMRFCRTEIIADMKLIIFDGSIRYRHDSYEKKQFVLSSISDLKTVKSYKK